MANETLILTEENVVAMIEEVRYILQVTGFTWSSPVVFKYLTVL